MIQSAQYKQPTQLTPSFEPHPSKNSSIKESALYSLALYLIHLGGLPTPIEDLSEKKISNQLKENPHEKTKNLKKSSLIKKIFVFITHLMGLGNLSQELDETLLDHVPKKPFLEQKPVAEKKVDPQLPRIDKKDPSNKKSLEPKLGLSTITPTEKKQEKPPCQLSKVSKEPHGGKALTDLRPPSLSETRNISKVENLDIHKEGQKKDSVILRYPFAAPQKASIEIQTDTYLEAPKEKPVQKVRFSVLPAEEKTQMFKPKTKSVHEDVFYVHPPRNSTSKQGTVKEPIRPHSPDILDQTTDFFKNVALDVAGIFDKILPFSDGSPPKASKNSPASQSQKKPENSAEFISL